MKELDTLIRERNIPDALTLNSGRRVADIKDFEKRRGELRKILSEEIYGYIPPIPDHVQVELLDEDDIFCAGKAPLRTYELKCSFGDKTESFKFYSVIPKNATRLPAFVMINFRDSVPDKYLPSEEIADRGYAVFSFCYNDVTKDNGDFSDGFAALFSGRRRRKNSPGKIAMWAWAAMRIMDYIETLDCIDCDNVAVIGHSRLGKTALLTGAFDERFKYVISNDSGCSGAAISRGKGGETVSRITEVFPYWFCPRYTDNAPDFEKLGYDQNFLLALSVPRHLMIGSAEEDLWADPVSEFLCLYETNRVYSLYGMKGLITPDSIPPAKCDLGKGDALYHLRHGKHYFSREDWISYMDYIDSILGRKQR